MQYTIKYDPQILWQGRTEYHKYFLHRAMIVNDEEGWMVPGYLLAWENGTSTGVDEVYGENNIEPGNGLYGDQIRAADETDKPLPPADHRDIVEFAEKFSELCEENNDPLLDSEILI